MLAVASSSGCLASSSLKADYSLHTADFCSYLSSSVPVWSTSPAAARPAEATPESLDGPAEANPAAPDGLAASDSGDSPRNQLIHAVSSSTGSSGIPGTGAGASDSSGSDGHSSCSSDVDNLAGAPGSDEGSAGSGGPSGPRKPAFGASHEEQSRRPLVEEAKAYLLRHFPDSADTWKLFRADDLQHAEHQKAYVALQRHLFGMRVGVYLLLLPGFKAFSVWPQLPFQVAESQYVEHFPALLRCKQPKLESSQGVEYVGCCARSRGAAP